MLDDIIELHRAGRLPEAEAGYRELLAADPDDADVLHLLGILRGQRGDRAEGVALVRRAIECDGERAVFQHTLGEMQLHAGDPDAAEDAYLRAKELDPNLTSAHTGLGQVAFLRGNLEEAESHFRIALRADENDAQSLAGLGNIAFARGENEKASRHLTEAAKLAPGDVLIQGSLASVMLALDTPDFALQAANNALALKPDYAPARQVLGNALLLKGDLTGARAAFEELIAQGEQLAMAHLGMGDIARRQERHDEAIAHYERALEQEERLHPAANRRADSLARSGRVEQAISALRERALAFPDAAYTKVALASLLEQRNRDAEALSVWHEAAALLPRNGDVQASYALALDRAGEQDAALQQAQRVPADPPRPALALMRARAALRGGDADGALQVLNSLDRQWPQTPRMNRQRWRLAGLAHDALGQWDDAARDFMRTLREDALPLPELPELDEALVASARACADEALLSESQFDAPILLTGLPGCGAGRVAALLGQHPAFAMRGDRYGAVPDFVSAPFDERLLATLGQGDLALLQRRYARALQRIGLREGARVIDRLPWLDARVLPALKRALPGLRIVLVRSDPRDALLNWLAFGGNARVMMRDPVAAARWLKRALAHQKLAAELLPAHVIENAAELTADPEGPQACALAEFLGLGAFARDSGAREPESDRTGLPRSFAAGHAERYREALSPAFAALE
ncbi:MAG TPA: tetratricopeptide repeat protein [Rhodanobacteraceae bacterium]